MTSSSAPGGETQLATAAGISCYTIWGLLPLVFQLIGRLGGGPWEILAHRTVWGAPVALGCVLLARQGRAAIAVFRDRPTLAWLTLAAVLIAINWIIFIWAVNSGRVLETSLGYYILPLFNMAAGALIFGERLDLQGLVAIGLAAVGVVLQAVALGHLPLVSLALAVTFGAYGVVKKRVNAEAQAGMLVECALLAVPSFVFVLWLQAHGQGHFGQSLPLTGLLVACGLLTVIPLVLFAWAARRIPLSAMGFLQFIAPTMTFVIGVLQGEAFSPLRGGSFALIWAGVAVFAHGAWRKSRRVMKAAAPEAALAE
jgi:chloramphenicol-sensitive protein RarD